MVEIYKRINISDYREKEGESLGYEGYIPEFYKRVERKDIEEQEERS